MDVLVTPTRWLGYRDNTKRSKNEVEREGGREGERGREREREGGRGGESIHLALERQTAEMPVKPGGDYPDGWLHGLS